MRSVCQERKQDDHENLWPRCGSPWAALLPLYSFCVPAEETVGVEAGAGGREDVQKGMDGGGRVTQVQNEIYKFLRHKTQKNTFH